MSKYNFLDKNILITGATGGIGRAIVMAFLNEGCKMICITAKNRKPLFDLKNYIKSKYNTPCYECSADLSSANACVEMSEYFIDKAGCIDILVNNAGLNYPEYLQDLDIDHWNEIINVNLRAPALISKIIAQRMVEKSKGGIIINISSNAGVAGLEKHGAYCASKFGLNGLTKTMAIEWGKYNIRVNAIAPIIVMTELGQKTWGDPKISEPIKSSVPLGRFAKPHDIADLVLFLASENSSMINGEVILVDGGQRAKLY